MDLFVAILIVCVPPLIILLIDQRPGRAGTTLQRVRVYLGILFLLWTLTGVVWLDLHFHERSLWDIGLKLSQTNAFWVTAGVVITAVLVIAYRGTRLLAQAETLARVRGQIEQRHLDLLLPHTRPELSLFLVLAVSAGVCEEVLYRGYLADYLTRWVDFPQALAISAVAFGIGHAYQRISGVAVAIIGGVIFGFIYFVSESLVPAIILHTFLDIHSGRVGYAALNQPSSAR